MEDLIYFSQGIPAGVIAPSTVFSHQNGQLLINGPLGVANAVASDAAELQHALQAAGSLVPGAASEVDKVIKLLELPATSRTVSYLLCYARSCQNILDDISSLSEARVMIVGCGGIGSSLCMLLAGAGVKRFCLVDSDVIEKSNLNRQFFWTLHDVGRKKIDVLKGALEARFEGLDIVCKDAAPGIHELVEMASGGFQGVAITADNPPTLARDGWKLAKSCNLPVVAGGYLHQICASFLFLPHDCDDVEEAAKLVEDESWSSLPSAIRPSYGPMNLSLASVLSSNLIACLAMNTFGAQKTSIARWDSRTI